MGYPALSRPIATGTAPEQIAGYLGVAETGVVRDVSVLLRHGLLTGGDKSAAGAKRVKLAEKGRAALQVDPVKRLAGAMGRLSDARRTALAESLETVATHLARDADGSDEI